MHPPEIPFLQSHALPEGVEQWAEVVRAQQATIQAQQQTIETLEKAIAAAARAHRAVGGRGQSAKEAEGETQAGSQSPE